MVNQAQNKTANRIKAVDRGRNPPFPVLLFNKAFSKRELFDEEVLRQCI